MSIIPLIMGYETPVHHHVGVPVQHSHSHSSNRRMVQAAQLINWPNRHAEQDFGLPVLPDEYQSGAIHPVLTEDYYRPWRRSHHLVDRDIGSSMRTDENRIVINLDVKHFTPEELSVKTAGNFVIVEAKHDEKRDCEGAAISRQFTRRYQLPEGFPPEKVESSISSDGVLIIIAPRKQPEARERKVKISKMGPVRTDIRNDSQVGYGRPEYYAAPPPRNHYPLYHVALPAQTGVVPQPGAAAADSAPKPAAAPEPPAAEAAGEAAESAPLPAASEEQQK